MNHRLLWIMDGFKPFQMELGVMSSQEEHQEDVGKEKESESHEVKQSPTVYSYPEFEREIAEKEHFTGDFLKQVREYRHISLAEISNATRIGKNYLLGIEEERFNVFPALVYLKGFIRQYSIYIGLDPD